MGGSRGLKSWIVLSKRGYGVDESVDMVETCEK